MNQKPIGTNNLVKVIKVLISLATIAFIVYYFNTNAIWSFSTGDFFIRLISKFWVLPMLLLFVSINWWLESKKWQLLLSSKERINTITALKAVFSGVSIGLFTPNRIGEYAGRLWFVNNKVFAISATVIGNICQLSITMLMGIIALLFYSPKHLHPLSKLNSNAIIIGVLAVVVFLVLFIFRKQIFSLLSNKKASSLIALLDKAKGFSKKTLITALLLSGIRYFSFVLPFALLLSFAYSGNLFQFIWIVQLTYFLQTFVPTFAVAEIGVRTATIGLILESININPEPAIIVSILIWVINVMLPALVGIFIIWKTKTN
jgi:uncharacterized membrane protein YbhN (UPF0104 family)